MSKLNGEAAVKRAVEDLLKAERIPYWRMQAGNAVIPGRGRIRLNAPGTADLLAAPNFGHWCPMCEGDIPQFLWIEVKGPKGKPNKEQLDFADFVRGLNHHHIFVNDVTQLQDWLKENGVD